MAWTISKLFLRRKPAVVYVNTIASPFGALLALKLKVPFIWHIREHVDGEFYRFDSGLAQVSKYLGRAERVIFNSFAVQRHFEPLLPKIVGEVVYNGFSFDSVQFGSAENSQKLNQAIRLTIVGIIVPDKGQEDAVRVLAELARRGIDAQLELIGHSHADYEAQLRNLAEQLGVSDRISWVGRVSDVTRYFLKTDIALVCSRHEAFGRVAVEALAVGTPVIATDIGGLPEIVSQEVGLLYEPGNIDQLANKILTLSSDPGYRSRLASYAAADIRTRFSIENYAATIESRLVSLVRPDGSQRTK